MINGSPINAVPLNSLSASGSVQTQIISPGNGFSWRPVVFLGGVDVSAKLLGSIGIEASEAGDKVASLALWLGPDPVTIGDYAGQALTIDFVVAGTPEIVDRRFTGYLVQPSFDPVSRVLSCEATTRLSDTIEAMEIEDIDLMVGGLWSDDVFEAVDGRSRWDYAQERMSTQAFSLNVDKAGQPRLTPWFTNAVHYEFAQGSTVFQSVDVGLSTLSDAVNIVELEVDYRFTRYRQKDQGYSWLHPGTSGNQGLLGFQAWRANSTELPDVEMVTAAVDSAGWWLSNPGWYRLFGDLPNADPPWYNKNTDLLLGATFTASVRWTQRVIEQYRIRLEIPAAVAAVDEVIQRERFVLDTDSSDDTLWDESGGTAAGEPDDDPIDELPRRDQGRLDAALSCALAICQVILLKAQRANVITWQVPLAHALRIDLGQRLRLNDQGALVTGTVSDLKEEMDIDSGAAVLSISVSVSRGDAAGIADPLNIPTAPVFSDDPAAAFSGVLPTQIGLRAESPLYDDVLAGFAGSYSIGNGNPELRYPRRFAIDTPEIPEQWRDENQSEKAVVYRVAPPSDKLEL